LVESKQGFKIAIQQPTFFLVEKETKKLTSAIYFRQYGGQCSIIYKEHNGKSQNGSLRLLECKEDQETIYLLQSQRPQISVLKKRIILAQPHRKSKLLSKAQLFQKDDTFDFLQP